MKLKIYHNPQCKKSRAALQFLKDHNHEVDVREYLKQPLTEQEFEKLLVKLNLPVAEMVRTQEAEYKSRYKGKTFTEQEWVKILLASPRLIRRPIIERDFKAVIGDPIENIDAVI